MNPLQKPQAGGRWSAGVVGLAQTIGLFLLGAQWMSPLCSLAADLQTIARRGQVTIAVKDNLRPLGFRDGSGQLQGLEIDIAQRLAKELLGQPLTVTLRPVGNRDRLSVILNGQADLTIAKVTATQPRTRLVSLSIPYYFDGTGLITKNPAIRGQADLQRQKVGVLKESSTIATLRYRLPTAELVGVDSYAAGQALLDAGQVAAFAADVSVLSGWAANSPGYRVLADRLSVEPLCIVLPKGVQYDELRRRINAAIERWYAEGWLQERATYWGLPWDTLK